MGKASTPWTRVRFGNLCRLGLDACAYVKAESRSPLTIITIATLPVMNLARMQMMFSSD